MSDFGFEETVLQRLIPELKAEGYDVVREPNQTILPEFMKNYKPDLIAVRGEKNIAIELKRGSEKQESSLEEISKLFEGRKDWEFRVFWLSKPDEFSGLKRQSKQKILDFYQKCLELAENGSYAPAFLLSWATLEAAARRAFSNEMAKPQTPGRVIEQLANLGYLTSTEADDLRSLALLRNRIIHGELDVGLSKTAVDKMLNSLGTVINLLSKPSSKVA